MADAGEKQRLATFFAGRAADAISDMAIDDDDDDDAHLLAQVARERAARKTAEADTGRAVAHFVRVAEEATGAGRLMDAVGAYTQALEVDPANASAEGLEP